MARQRDGLKDAEWMAKALGLAARALARREFPVGCVLVAEDEVAGEGERRHSRGKRANELDHAEIRALRDWLSRGRIVAGPSLGLTAYCTLEPCLMCLGALILNGVGRIVYAYEDVMGGAAGLNLSRPLTAAARPSGSTREVVSLYQAAKMDVVGGVARPESLHLFQEFFSDPRNHYWRESPLAHYTLSQGAQLHEDDHTAETHRLTIQLKKPQMQGAGNGVFFERDQG